ncbi:hypothetical protein FRC06_006388 [Ceratobasidium sp. 370]|nr:hypothetical protein FRC06_006388 [Ceratobasidium sp. 370]
MASALQLLRFTIRTNTFRHLAPLALPARSAIRFDSSAAVLFDAKARKGGPTMLLTQHGYPSPQLIEIIAII